MHQPHVFVIGCGYHLQILGSQSCPLNSWQELLRTVAMSSGIKQLDTRPERFTYPTEFWERMVTRKTAAQGSYNASVIESRLKTKACQIIKECAEKQWGKKYATSPLTKAMADRLSMGRVHLISLNFDDLGYRALYQREGVRPFQRRLRNRYATADPMTQFQKNLRWKTKFMNAKGLTATVWHPHGNIRESASIHLGLRDYGMLPASYAKAFGKFKEWQRHAIGGSSHNARTISDRDYARLLSKLEAMDRDCATNEKNDADTWITRLMLLPVTFIGVGLSVNEIGLRWILTQRERNLARVTNPPPCTKITVPSAAARANCPAPLGAKLRHFQSTNEAWHQALSKL
jgi:hypothetical protein